MSDYYIDSPTLKVDAYDYDDPTGDISNRRTIMEYSPDDGVPDGMTFDTDGNLWVAHWGGHQVNPPTTLREMLRADATHSGEACAT